VSNLDKEFDSFEDVELDTEKIVSNLDKEFDSFEDVELDTEEFKTSDTPQDQVEIPSEIETALRSGAEGLLFGGAGEIEGGLKAAYETAFGEAQLKDIMDTYRSERDKAEARRKAGEEAHPSIALASEIAGGIAPAFFTGGASAVASAGKVGAKQALKQLMKSGAKAGAAYGVGKSEADLTKGEVGEFVKDVAKEALTGAVAAPVLTGGLKVAGKGTGLIKGGLKKGVEIAKEQSAIAEKVLDAAETAYKKVPFAGKTSIKRNAEELKNMTKEALGDGEGALQTIARDLDDEVTKIASKYQNKIDVTDDLANVMNYIDDLIAESVDDEAAKALLNFKDKLTEKVKDVATTDVADYSINKMLMSGEQLHSLRKKINSMSQAAGSGTIQRAMSEARNLLTKKGMERIALESGDQAYQKALKQQALFYETLNDMFPSLNTLSRNIDDVNQASKFIRDMAIQIADPGQVVKQQDFIHFVNQMDGLARGFADRFGNKILKKAKLIDLGQTARGGGGEVIAGTPGVQSAIGGGIQAAGVKTGAALGSTARMVKDIANLPATAIQKLSLNARRMYPGQEGERMSNFINEVAQAPDITSKNALLFSASQQPAIKSKLMELLQSGEENE